MEEWVPTKEAADILGVDPDWIRKLCLRKRIHCQKLGREWMVSRASIEAYAQSDRKPGPKPLNYEETSPKEMILKEEKGKYQAVTIYLTKAEINHLENKYGSVPDGIKTLINSDLK